MGFLRNRLLRRFSIIGRIADLVLVGSMALRLAQRKGWIDSKRVDQYGLDDDLDEQSVGIPEIALAGAALYRLVRRKKA